jgi:hypothetical protein
VLPLAEESMMATMVASGVAAVLGGLAPLPLLTRIDPATAFRP